MENPGGSPSNPSSGAERLERTRRRMDIMNENEADTLSQAKDRGQVTMTSAMSITNVALLKAVLDRGPENNQFYTLTIVFISLALGLQVLAGLLSLGVSQLRSFYQKFNDDAGADMYWCPIAIRCKNRKDNTDFGCCPCGESANHYDNWEQQVIRSWRDWVERDTELDVAAAEADIMLDYLDDVIEKSQQQLTSLKSAADDKDGLEYKAKLDEIFEKISYAQKRRRKYIDAKCAADTANAQGEILSSQMNDVMRNHVLKRAQAGQHVINYLLYAAFIINAFLTGFGIAS